MTVRFKQYDHVELSHDIMSDETVGQPVLLKEGQRGVIVEVYTFPTIGYEVEFCSETGQTLAIMTLGGSDIRSPKRNS